MAVGQVGLKYLRWLVGNGSIFINEGFHYEFSLFKM